MTRGPGWRKCTAYRQPGPRGTPLGLGLNEGLGISARGRQTRVHLHVWDSASRFAPPQEQSRYPASAARAADLAWRSAPCSADHQLEFLARAYSLHPEPIRAPRTPPHIHPSANPPSRSALRHLVAASGGVLVRLDRPAFTPALTEIGLLYRPVSSVGLAATPRAGGICGLAASWLFSSRRQAHFPAGVAHGRVSDA